MSTNKPNLAAGAERRLVITRIFDAPRSLVFKAWVEDERIKQWSAPQGLTLTHSEGDVRPGGRWRACMTSPEGRQLWLGGVYREVVENDRLVFTHIWDDEGEGKPGPETIVSVTFEDVGDKTKMTFEQTGFASEASRDDHNEGWSECFDLLAAYLAAAG